jgi:hypothetical protein
LEVIHSLAPNSELLAGKRCESNGGKNTVPQSVKQYLKHEFLCQSSYQLTRTRSVGKKRRKITIRRN